MRFTVELVVMDDGGATIHAPSGYLRLTPVELSQLHSLLERHFAGRSACWSDETLNE